MKKLLYISLFLPFSAFSQNTTTLPTGTAPTTPQFRTLGSDSLHQTWINFPGIGYNQFYTATEVNKYFLRSGGSGSANGLFSDVNGKAYSPTGFSYNSAGNVFNFTKQVNLSAVGLNSTVTWNTLPVAVSTMGLGHLAVSASGQGTIRDTTTYAGVYKPNTFSLLNYFKAGIATKQTIAIENSTENAAVTIFANTLGNRQDTVQANASGTFAFTNQLSAYKLKSDSLPTTPSAFVTQNYLHTANINTTGSFTSQSGFVGNLTTLPNGSGTSEIFGNVLQASNSLDIVANNSIYFFPGDASSSVFTVSPTEVTDAFAPINPTDVLRLADVSGFATKAHADSLAAAYSGQIDYYTFPTTGTNTITDASLINMNVSQVFRGGLSYDIITSGSPNGNQVLVNTSIGSLTFADNFYTASPEKGYSVFKSISSPSPITPPNFQIKYAPNYATAATYFTGTASLLIFVKNDEVNGGTNTDGSYASTLYQYTYNNTTGVKLFYIRTGAN